MSSSFRWPDLDGRCALRLLALLGENLGDARDVLQMAPRDRYRDAGQSDVLAGEAVDDRLELAWPGAARRPGGDLAVAEPDRTGTCLPDRCCLRRQRRGRQYR